MPGAIGMAKQMRLLVGKPSYRAMDFLLESLPELRETVLFTVADLLHLQVDLLFFDTTSTYFELEQADTDPNDETAPGFRSHGHYKDHRDDLPQAVIGMAVTRGGVPGRLWGGGG
jgi:transposase